MKRIILASASPRRRELLKLIGIEFDIMVSSKEETYSSAQPEDIVLELALMKAENAASELKDNMCRDLLIIGADTVVVSESQIMGKPKDEKEAFHMIQNLQGKVHQVFTGVAILEFDSNGTVSTISRAVETKVYVHEMNTAEIDAYVKSGEPLDKAGGYGIQGAFAAYIDKIEGDYYNVVGLPISYIYQQISRCGMIR